MIASFAAMNFCAPLNLFNNTIFDPAAYNTVAVSVVARKGGVRPCTDLYRFRSTSKFLNEEERCTLVIPRRLTFLSSSSDDDGLCEVESVN